MTTKKELGQFYTKDLDVSYLFYKLLKHQKYDKILEPACGDATLICNLMQFVYQNENKDALDIFLAKLYINDIDKIELTKGVKILHKLILIWLKKF